MPNFGIVAQSFKMSLQNIKANKMRSFLTMLGIIIGVASVIALITIVQSVSDYVMNQFSDLGAGTLTVSVNGTAMKAGLTSGDLKRLETVDGVEGVSPSMSLSTLVAYEDEVYEEVSVSGRATIYFEKNAERLLYGRMLSDRDMTGESYVCVVDQKFMETVMRGDTVLGNHIRIAGYEYEIVGILSEDESMMSAFMSGGGDGAVIIPYTNVMDVSMVNYVNSVEIYYGTATESSILEDDLSAELDNIFNNAEHAYSILNMESLMEAMSTIEGMMSTMLGGIASIALLVGGIGIMNMMLVSVSERTKEIGLRKALGAEPLRIQLQFLIESVVLSVFGGILGVILGLLIAMVASAALDTTFSLQPNAVLLGLGFSIAVGVIFGWMPAKRASDLNPIDALRSE
ncbi:MAG: ABC transporter permease [Lachnospiraceae bacterium]|nr:ABC transporter permease [Lachnospiraceae bacterium]